MPDTALRTGGQILVEQLKIQGCDRVFTVPGESFLAVLDALHDAPEIETMAIWSTRGLTQDQSEGLKTGRSCRCEICTAFAPASSSNAAHS